MAAHIKHPVNNVPFLFSSQTRVHHEYRVSGKTLNLGHRSDQRKTLKERDHQLLTRNLKRVRRATFPQIAEDFNAGALRNVSVRTVERTIIDMGFRNRCLTRVSLLTVRHTDLRLAWARQRRHLTVDYWKQVARSDESHFQLYREGGHILVWRQPHESMEPTCQQGSV
ncbi:hypothetical protein AVEN_151244-1 [Araneus ventricosus]|uniref:Transposase Tc1-like domain-containing protein n=1 Tax=Araneus ventricosus TaxID=182803 RepID=A0A4Y2NK66_ARAVE|nr:hypothetical protein AVEN_151244-1 [Araneus ventricosus]